MPNTCSVCMNNSEKTRKQNVKQERLGLSPLDLRRIDIVYGPECRKRDRQEKIELCQNYPGVARKKREATDMPRSLRVNPAITPPADIVEDSSSNDTYNETVIPAHIDEIAPPANQSEATSNSPKDDAYDKTALSINDTHASPAKIAEATSNGSYNNKDNTTELVIEFLDTSVTALPAHIGKAITGSLKHDTDDIIALSITYNDALIKQLDIEKEIERFVVHINRLSARILSRTKTKICQNGTKASLRTRYEKPKILDIIGQLVSYTNDLVEKATQNLTEFCSDAAPMNVYQRSSCPFFDKKNCPKSFRSTKSGPVKYSTQHRPVYQQSTRPAVQHAKNQYIKLGSLRKQMIYNTPPPDAITSPTEDKPWYTEPYHGRRKREADFDTLSKEIIRPEKVPQTNHSNSASTSTEVDADKEALVESNFNKKKMDVGKKDIIKLDSAQRRFKIKRFWSKKQGGSGQSKHPERFKDGWEFSGLSMEQERSEDSKAGSGSEASRYQSQVSKSKYADKSSEEASGNTETEEINLPKPDSASRIRTHVKKNLDEDERRPILRSRVEDNEPNPRGLKTKAKESQKDDGHPGSNEQNTNVENSEVTTGQKMGGVPVEDHENEESPASSVSRIRTHVKKNLDEDERRPSLGSRVEENEPNPRGLKARGKESQKDDGHQGSNEQHSKEENSEVTKAQKMGGVPVEDHENEESPASSVSRSRTHDKKNLDEDERRPSLRSRVEDNEANPRGLKARVKESQKDDDHQGSNEQNSNEGSSEVTKAQKIGGLPVEDHENEEYPASKKKTKGNRGPQKVLKPSKFRKPQRPLEPAQSGESNEAPEAQEAQKSGLPRIVNLPKPTREFYDERKWPDGVVRYVIKDTEDAAVDIGDVRKRLAEVTRLLEERTCVRLQELTEASAEKFEDYLVLDSSPDYVTGRVGGKQNFGVTELLLGGQHRQHAAMVVMAMLGFYFEVARHDRDKHIRVHMRNIRADKLHHFEKIRDDATFPLPYDYKSATHPAWQFWREIDKTGKSTVATFKKMDPDGSMMRSLGQNTPLLSDLDVVKINSVYGIECFKRKPKGRKLQQIKEKEGNFNNKEKIEEKHEELEKEVNGKESDEE